MSDSLVICANCSQKMSYLLEKIHIFLHVFTAFPLLIPKSESLLSLFSPSLFCKERLERFAHIALYKKATMSELLFPSFAHKKRWKPKSEFPTLSKWRLSYLNPVYGLVGTCSTTDSNGLSRAHYLEC